MTKQSIARKQTHSSPNKTAYIRAGLVVFALLCLAPSTIVVVNAGTVRIKSGYWMRYDSINVGDVPFNSQTVWSKVEFLNVCEPTVIMRVTSRMSNGTEKVGAGCCMPSSGGPIRINVEANSEFPSGFSGFVIPTDLNVGNVFRISGWGTVTITGKTLRTYAGASRTVVYALFSGSGASDQSGIETISYWDRQTGIFLEETTTAPNFTMSFKATQTNMWTASGSEGFSWQLLGIAAAPVAAIIATIAVILYRRHSITSTAQTNQSPI